MKSRLIFLVLLIFVFCFYPAYADFPTLPSSFGDHPWALGLDGGFGAEVGFYDKDSYSDSLFFAARFKNFAAGLERDHDVLDWRFSLGGRAADDSIILSGISFNLISGEGYTDFTTTLGWGFGFDDHFVFDFLIRDIVLSKSAGGRIMPRYEAGFIIGAGDAPLSFVGSFSLPARGSAYGFGAELFVRPISGIELSVGLRRENKEYIVGAGLGLALGGERGEMGAYYRAGLEHRDSRNVIMASVVYGDHGRGDLLNLAHNSSFLELVVSGSMNETPEEGSFIFGKQASLGFASYLLALYRASQDSAFSLVLVRLRDHSLGYARSEELMEALLALRAAGKKVIVALEKGGLRNFLIASAADEVHLDPHVQVEIARPAMSATFYKNLLSKIGLEAQLLYRSEYKTAAQSFTEESITPAHREAANRVLDRIERHVFARIARNRGLEEARVASWCQAALMTPDEALKEGLVSHLGSYDSLRRSIGRAGLRARDLEECLSLPSGFSTGNAIAIVNIEGSIVNGTSTSSPLPFLGRSVGAETIIRALSKALADRRIRGIIVRVNSGGGDILASARMREAIILAAKRKPLIISMGDVAASGGFWLSCGDTDTKLDICAGAATLTGSIGVIAGKVSSEKLRALIGVKTERLGDEGAFLFSDDKSFTPDERALVEKMLDYWYGKFVDIVAEGRRIQRDAVEENARGRAWAGEDAHAFGLVDHTLGLMGAYTLLVKRLGGNPLKYSFIEMPASRASIASMVTGGIEASLASLANPDTLPGLFVSGRPLALQAWNWAFE